MSDQNQKVQNQENEIAVPIEVQQKAALYGIASVLVGTGKVPNKKSVKGYVKCLRREVIAEIGPLGGEELLMQNKQAVEGIFAGIRKNPTISKADRKNFISKAVDDLYISYTIGIYKLYGG